MNKYCHNCGKKAQEGDKFCTNCGAKLDLRGKKTSSNVVSSVMDEIEGLMNEFLLRYKNSSIYDKLISNEYHGLSACGMNLFLADTEVQQAKQELDLGLKSIQRLVEEINETYVFSNQRNSYAIQKELNKKMLEIEKIKAKNLFIQEKIKKANAKRDSIIKETESTNNISITSTKQELERKNQNKNKELEDNVQKKEKEINDVKNSLDELALKDLQLRSTIEKQNTFSADSTGESINDVKSYLSEQEKKCAVLDSIIIEKKESIEELTKTIQLIEADISRKQKSIVELDDTILLQEVGLYKPLYTFANSSDYKNKLEECRMQQKEMIREKTAVTCKSKWMVNGDIALGKKLINDRIKEIALMFNTECENATDKVKYNNFESMKNRILRMYDKLNDYNEPQQINISRQYLNLKLEELALAFEYAQKVQEEKEYIREQREIARENAKVQKEIEEERKRIAKEKTHYANALHRLQEQLFGAIDPEKHKAIEQRISEINTELDNLETALKEIDYRQANERAGYVYVISNIGAFGEGVYKIGMTRRLDPMDRIDELSGAAVPFHYDVHALIFSADAPKLESALHNAFSEYRVNRINTRKEFFKVSLEEIERVVRENHDRTVDFQYFPAAEQYRESQILYSKNV